MVKQRITILLVCGLHTLGLLGVAAAGPLEDGKAALKAYMWFNLAASRAEGTETRDKAVERRNILATVIISGRNRRGAAVG